MGHSIHVPSVQHSNPVPSASRVGGFVASGLITGRDPETGLLGASFEEQCRQMFINLKVLVEAAGADIQAILRITVWMNDRRQREALNGHWLKMFPDPDFRPARITLNRDLDAGKLVECEIIAVLQNIQH
jgi:2-iminobutanoate/2-iminopropanoate deaminase